MTSKCGCGAEPGDCNGVWCAKCEGHHSDRACVDIAPRKEWYLVSEPGESGYRVAIFRKSEVVNAYGPITQDNVDDVIARLVGWGASYNGPGRGFCSDPYIVIKGSKLIVKQFCGLDI